MPLLNNISLADKLAGDPLTNRYTGATPALASYAAISNLASYLTALRGQIRKSRDQGLSLEQLIHLDRSYDSTSTSRARRPMIPNLGICANINLGIKSQLDRVTNTASPSTLAKLRIIEAVKSACRDYEQSWPKYSGNTMYPVPASLPYVRSKLAAGDVLNSGGYTPAYLANAAYSLTTGGDMFGIITETRYTRDRNLLVAYMVRCAKEDLRILAILRNNKMNRAGDIN